VENNGLFVNGKGRPRVLIVGAGFAGFTYAHELEKKLGQCDAELLLVSPTDYMLYSPLLPEVVAGVMDPRHVAVPLHEQLKRTRLVTGYAVSAEVPAWRGRSPLGGLGAVTT
jgi:NADH dehydrogenase